METFGEEEVALSIPRRSFSLRRFSSCACRSDVVTLGADVYTAPPDGADGGTPVVVGEMLLVDGV